jgi:hypothetical protein
LSGRLSQLHLCNKVDLLVIFLFSRWWPRYLTCGVLDTTNPGKIPGFSIIWDKTENIESATTYTSLKVPDSDDLLGVSNEALSIIFFLVVWHFFEPESKPKLDAFALLDSYKMRFHRLRSACTVKGCGAVFDTCERSLRYRLL